MYTIILWHNGRIRLKIRSYFHNVLCLGEAKGMDIKMKTYQELSRQELEELRNTLTMQFEEIRGKGLKLDMSRGKPAPDQLDIVMPMMDVLNEESILKTEEGTDCRNYGMMDGIPEAKKLLSEMLDITPEKMLVNGNSSLSLMFDAVSHSVTHGVCGSTPWCKLDKVKFLCPVPGYDRHFKVTEFFGIEMITVPMTEDGPDMDLVEKYVSEDVSVKGIWCVPKYSNPQGYTYSDETVRRFAALKPAAEDFRVYWDNAYCIHDLYKDRSAKLLEIFAECDKAGNPDLVFEFCSTSKISFAGAGISGLAASEKNLKWFKSMTTIQTIGPDKVNQLRHVRYYKNKAGLQEQMRKHSDLIRPKFELVEEMLENELGGLGIGAWTKPLGGYFISFDALEGCAKAIVAKCKEGGMVLTGAGATYPYGKDPKDSNIRIAPSYPSLEEMKLATELFILCVKLVSIDKLLS